MASQREEENRGMGKPAPETTLDIVPSVIELAYFMQKEPKGVDRELIKRGDDLIAIFEDANFSNGFKNLREQKINAIASACRDIAEGVKVLHSSVIGVTFHQGKMEQATVSLGTPPEGSFVFSVTWRAKRAFHAWRTEGAKEVSQDDINASLYRLAHTLSKVIQVKGK